MEYIRRKTREISVGKVKIGAYNPIAVQSMIKSRIENMAAVKNEIKILESCGCEIIRIAVPDKEALKSLKRLISEKIFTKPVVADIQFDHRLAIDSIDAGADCVRINPGNIGGLHNLEAVVKKAVQKNASIRIGVNSGSISKDIIRKNNGNILYSIVDSTIDAVAFLENLNFNNFKISAKASSVTDTISAYEIISSKTNYPLHVGVTEAGPLFPGVIKSSLGIGILLSKGIGDTIRVSLTDSSASEVKAAFLILSNLNLRKCGINIISCPTCSRTRVNLGKIVKEVEKITTSSGQELNLNIAVMGCIVNGPGEARDADLGIAYGINKAAIFKNGKIVKRVIVADALHEFEKEFKNYSK